MKLFFLPLRLDPCFSLKLELIFYNLELWDRDKLRGKKEVNEEVKSIANPIFLSQMQSNPSKAFSRFKYYLGIQESAKETDLKKKLGWKKIRECGIKLKEEKRIKGGRFFQFLIVWCLVYTLKESRTENWKSPAKHRNRFVVTFLINSIPLPIPTCTGLCTKSL